jgi:hypothetical protein
MTLTKLVVEVLHEDDLGDIGEVVFGPLLAFPNIAHIEINTRHVFRLGNGLLRDIANSWIQLQSLRIGSPLSRAGKSQITLAGLIPLLSLTKLKALSIVVDAPVVDYTLDMPPIGVANTEISVLSLGNSLVGGPSEVAALVSDVLPNVRKIISWTQAPVGCLKQM